MNNVLKNKFLWVNIFLCITGFIFLILESTFYQYIDENNVLQESLFLPLGFIFLFIGLLGFIFLMLKYLFLKIK